MSGTKTYLVRLREGAVEKIKADHGISSDAELARRVRISPPTLHQMQSGRRGVGAAFIAGAALHLGIPFFAGPDSIYQIEEA